MCRSSVHEVVTYFGRRRTRKINSITGMHCSFSVKVLPWTKELEEEEAVRMVRKTLEEGSEEEEEVGVEAGRRIVAPPFHRPSPIILINKKTATNNI